MTLLLITYYQIMANAWTEMLQFSDDQDGDFDFSRYKNEEAAITAFTFHHEEQLKAQGVDIGAGHCKLVEVHSKEALMTLYTQQEDFV